MAQVTTRTRTLKDGSTVEYYYVGYRKPDGKSTSRSFPKGKKKEAKLFAASVEVRTAEGTFIDPAASRLTYAQWVEEYDRVRRRLRPSTEARNASLMANHVLPHFGWRQLGRVDHLLVQEWATALVDAPEDGGRGLAASSAANVFNCLDKTLQAAVKARRLAVNPATGVELPKVEAEERRFLTPDEVRRLADAMPEPYRALVLLSCATSLRIGELAGLRRAHVDLLRRRVRVVEIATDTKGHLAYGPPKTPASIRTIPISRNLAEVMTEHLAAHAQDGPEGLVFPAPGGGGMRPNNFRKRVWADAVEAAGLPGVTPHAMKHTAVARWISAGWDPKRIAVCGAHKTVKTIYDQYGHLMEHDDDDAAERVEAQLAPQVRPVTDLGSRRAQ